MLRKFISFLIITAIFSFCCTTFGAKGVDAPSKLKKDVFLFFYESTTKTVYLQPSNDPNFSVITIYNNSSQSYFFKIKTDIPGFKYMGIEVEKHFGKILFPYTGSDIYLRYLEKWKNTKIEIEIFNINKTKILKKILVENIKKPRNNNNDDNVIMTNNKTAIKAPRTNSLTMEVVVSVFLNKTITTKIINIAPGQTISLVGDNMEYLIGVTDSKSTYMGSKYFYLRENISILPGKDPKKDQPQSLWPAQTPEKEIYIIFPKQNKGFLLLYSENKSDILTKLIVEDKEISTTTSLKKGWNKISFYLPEIFFHKNIEVVIGGTKFPSRKLISGIYQNFDSLKNINFTLNNNNLMYNYNFEKTNKYIFLVFQKEEGLIYGDFLSEARRVNPSYLDKKIKLNNNNPVVIVNFSNIEEVVVPTTTLTETS